MNKALMQIYAQRGFLCVVVGLAYAVAAPAIPHAPHMAWYQAACAFLVITEIIGAVRQ